MQGIHFLCQGAVEAQLLIGLINWEAAGSKQIHTKEGF